MDRTTVLDDEWVMKIQLLSKSNHLLSRFAGAGDHRYACRLQTPYGLFRRGPVVVMVHQGAI
jgi:hypothetical protein